jgi:hypothetical protein
LHVIFLATWPGTGDRLGPGAIAVSEAAILQGALRLNVSAPDVARAVLMHYAGHALGVVNDGIPIQDPNLQEREGPANHEPDPASVMHVGWHQASTMTWPVDANFTRYSDAVAASWQGAAASPDGACRQ